MKTANTNLTKVLLPRYNKEWVALNEQQTKVVAKGKTVEEVVAMITRQKIKNPVLTYAVKDYQVLVS